MFFDRFHRLLACAGLALLGCGEQTSTDYEGESLLHFSGRVKLLDAQSDDLIPVLAFPGKNAYWQFMDVSVHGEFPSRFTLDVFDRPPDDALPDSSSSILEDEPAWTYARIAAVGPDHAPGFQYYNYYGVTPDCDVLESCHRIRRDYCYADGSDWDGDRPDASHCYTDIRECDFVINSSFDENYDDCKVVETKGDPSLAADPTTHFSGFSVDHFVVYLATEAPAGSLIGRMLGEEKRVAPGYHLVKSKKRTQAEIDEADSCNSAADKVAAQRFTHDHPDIVCELSEGSDDFFSCEPEHSADLWPYKRRAQAEAHCPFVGDASLSLVDTDSTELTIRIGYDVGNAGLGTN